MLAIFEKSVAKCPEALRTPQSNAHLGANTSSVVSFFASENSGAVTISLGSSGSISYTANNQNPLLPRLFAAVDDMFCIFQGRIENIVHLKQQYGLGKNATEVIIVIEAYRTLRDRGPYPVDQVLRDLQGKFAFVLFDGSSNSVFVATDADGGVPFFWGTNSEDQLIFSENRNYLQKSCGKSFAPFPKGCFFTTSGGLQSFEHPLSELKAMPRVDSEGHVCGANFKVDPHSKKEVSMPRVGSAANWASHF